jgi:hypothetical protein
MPADLPPDRCPGQAATGLLPEGTRLWRVHSMDYPAHGFNPVPSDRKIGGGRFDCTSLRYYPYLYAAAEQSTALMETVVRSLLFDKRTGRRTIVRVAIERLRMSAVELTRDLRILLLGDQRELNGVCATEWLVHTEALDYDLTRRWAMWLHGRDWLEQEDWPGAPQGMLWQSKRDQPRQAMMFFGDRCADAIRTVPGEGYLLDDPACHDTLTSLLLPYGVTLNPPGKVSDPGR